MSGFDILYYHNALANIIISNTVTTLHNEYGRKRLLNFKPQRHACDLQCFDCAAHCLFRYSNFYYRAPRSTDRVLVMPMVIIKIIRAILRARSRGLELKVAVKNGVLRTFLTYLRPRQLQFLLPSGHAVFQRWVASKEVRAEEKINTCIETLQDGEAKLFWVGHREESSKVILFFHG